MSSNGSGGSSPGNLAVKALPAAAAAIILVVIAVAGLSRVGCANHHTPPGHEGYIKSKPLVGAGAFVGTQHGPKSTGWVWRQNVVNIDFRPRTFSEEMSILTSNRLELAFRAHGRVQLRLNTVREVVENYGGENWYENNVRKQFRSVVRDQVQRLEPFEVKDKRGKKTLATVETDEGVFATTTEGLAMGFSSVWLGDSRRRVCQLVADRH